MNHRKILLSLAASVLFTAFCTFPVQANDFYAGKTIRVTVGLAAGGGYDTYARIIARHMGKYIPGNPTFVVDNMEGAGGLIAANYTYNNADRDGTFIGVWNSAYVLYQALGDRAVRLDASKLNWIGAPIKGSPSCSIMARTGLKTIDDVVSSGRELKMGSTRAGSTKTLDDVLQTQLPLKAGATRAGSAGYDMPLILNKTLGTKFEVVVENRIGARSVIAVNYSYTAAKPDELTIIIFSMAGSCSS